VARPDVSASARRPVVMLVPASKGWMFDDGLVIASAEYSP